jgi:hypothetical protein
MTKKRIREVCGYLLRCARSASLTRPLCCELCKDAPPVVKNEADMLLCAGCVSPGDEIVLDARPRVSLRKVA